jgi:hypothetical protein
MFGIADPGIWSVYLLSILSAAICIGYGLVNWNKGGNDGESQIREEKILDEAKQKAETNL